MDKVASHKAKTPHLPSSIRWKVEDKNSLIFLALVITFHKLPRDITMRLTTLFITIVLLVILSGCTVVSVVVGTTTAVVGGAIDVVDVVTPDIFDDDDDEGKEL